MLNGITLSIITKPCGENKTHSRERLDMSFSFLLLLALLHEMECVYVTVCMSEARERTS
jgi:hypothetical protein